MEITKEILMELYNNQRMTQKKIAQSIGTHQSIISHKMKAFNIPARDRSESRKGRQKWGGHRKCPWISISNKEKPRMKGLKGHPPRNKGLPKEEQPRFGKRHHEKCMVCGIFFEAMPCLHRKYCSKQCQSIASRIYLRGRIVSKETRERQSQSKKIKNAFMWLSKDPEFQHKRLKGLVKKPTNPEKDFIEIIRKHDFPLKYVGNGEVLIGALNPDFIHSNGEKKVIEIFGRIFHDTEKAFMSVDWKRQPFGRLAYFSQHGYKCLIFWDDELRNEEVVVSKINSFLEIPH